MEVEFEQGDHEFDHLFGVLGESFLQFARVAYEHLTGCGLLLQTGRTDAELLLEKTVEIHVFVFRRKNPNPQIFFLNLIMILHFAQPFPFLRYQSFRESFVLKFWFSHLIA